MQTLTTLPTRYWEKVDKTAECWIWTGARNNFGYGVIGAKSITGRSHEYAHRLMFWLHGGSLVEGEVVDHTCGKGHKGCVTPEHLKALRVSENGAQGGYKTRKLVCSKCKGQRIRKGTRKVFYCPPCDAAYQKNYQTINKDRLNRKRRERRKAKKQ